MSNRKPIILGDKPKMTISATPIADVFTLAEIDWKVEFYASRGSVFIRKEDAVRIDDNTYAMRVDTRKTGTGRLMGVLHPNIPDRESESGYYTPPVPFDTGEEVVSQYYLREYGVHNK